MTHIVPRFSVAPDDGVASSPYSWSYTHEAELKAAYLDATSARSEVATASDYMIWCFKRYERYCEACAEQLEYLKPFKCADNSDG